MRVPLLTLAAAGAALLAPTVSASASVSAPVRPRAAEPAPHEGSVGAAELLARVRHCVPVSRGKYRTDAHAPATVPVCGTRDAVFWKADMDIDCDGRAGARCNARTDPFYSSMTAYRQSDGRYLDAERLPYIVVPAASGIWNHRAHGIGGGSIAAVVYRNRVRYAVVGDTGPHDIIGEASYATARSLGIRADPRHGGVGHGVTYIVFKNAKARPIEDHAAAVARGELLARRFARPAEPSRPPDPRPVAEEQDGTADVGESAEGG
ncbi:glycoside hydrolase family 75 protein [Streptomyces sp. NPDC005423]|uniref:glycoside hydrolase family 75 protein n=1 Tax=Streptomyces sp. NPDC005423 TaxID=3155343 RepID=UPI0033B391DA